MFYVYVLLLSNGKYYVGQTDNLGTRIQKHDKGDVISTSRYRPIKLVWYCAFSQKKKALKLEKYLKTASGRAFLRKRFL